MSRLMKLMVAFAASALVLFGGVANATPAPAPSDIGVLMHEVPCKEGPQYLEVFYETGHKCYAYAGVVHVRLPGAFTLLSGNNAGWVSYDTGRGIVDKRFEKHDYVGIPNATVVKIQVD